MKGNSSNLDACMAFMAICIIIEYSAAGSFKYGEWT
jgi:hypothetical protein